ncbi:MAG: hypothetical protein ABSB66_02590 [Candidatus Acidiferrales bacterium]|jgi:hypothetical protein
MNSSITTTTAYKSGNVQLASFTIMTLGELACFIWIGLHFYTRLPFISVMWLVIGAAGVSIAWYAFLENRSSLTREVEGIILKLHVTIVAILFAFGWALK